LTYSGTKKQKNHDSGRLGTVYYTESEQEQPQELIMEKETDLHGYLQKFKQLGAPGMKSEMV
jgi:hypothetical protein